MFCSAPIHTPIIPVRRSPKYFQVSESGPSGPVAVVVGFAVAVDVGIIAYDSARAGGRRYRLSTAAPQPRDRGLGE